jgi:protein associated with RNAse G/E
MSVWETEQGERVGGDMRRGDTIEIRAMKSDGTVYRSWRTTVEAVDGDRVVTVNRVGDQVGGPAGGWGMKHANRTIYWLGRPYNLSEVYQPDGRLKQIYIHIASPARVEDGVLIYTDYELDVVKRPGQPLRIVDEDEFEVATNEYGYSPEFCSACRQAVSEALQLAESWQIMGAPTFTSRRQRLFRRRGRGSRSSQEVRTETPATDSRMRRTEV